MPRRYLTGGGKSLKNQEKSINYFFKIFNSVKFYIKKVILKIRNKLSDGYLSETASRCKRRASAGGQEVPAAGIFGKYNYVTVCREISKVDLDTQTRSPCWRYFGQYNYITVCREISKVDLDTESKPLDSSTYNTGTGIFSGKPLDSSTYNTGSGAFPGKLLDWCTEKNTGSSVTLVNEKLRFCVYERRASAGGYFSEFTVSWVCEKIQNLYKKLTFAAYDKVGGVGTRATRVVDFCFVRFVRFLGKVGARAARGFWDIACTSRATKFFFRSDGSNFWSNEEVLRTGCDTSKVWLFRKIFREKKLLNSKGAILIEFAVCMPILIILLFYIHDLVKIKRYYAQTEFVGQQIANMIQNISQKRGAEDSTKITKEDLWHIHRLAWQSLYPGVSMFLDKNSKFSLDHRPITAMFYVKDVGNGKASCVWYIWLRGNTISKPEYTTNNLTTMKISTVNFLTNAAPENIYPTLKMNGEPKIIIETIMERANDGGNFNANSSEKTAIGLYLANPSMFRSSWSQMFHSVTIFTPKPGLFTEVAPKL